MHNDHAVAYLENLVEHLGWRFLRKQLMAFNPFMHNVVKWANIL